jgi:hypothetical protein
MAILVTVLAAAVLLLAVLVAGLLRSHAEILRALHELGAGVGEEPASATTPNFRVQQGLPGPGAAVTEAHDIAGTTTEDEAIAIGIVGAQQHTLVAFLSSGCLTCQAFWRAFAKPERLGLGDGTRVVIVTKSADEESESALRELAPGEVPVVMSSAAWADYGVPGSPYFVHVDGPEGRVVGEGAATSWEQVASLLGQADADRRAHRRSRRRGGHNEASRLHPADRDRADLVDRELLAAGIAPGDPSLYPTEPVDELSSSGLTQTAADAR